MKRKENPRATVRSRETEFKKNFFAPPHSKFITVCWLNGSDTKRRKKKERKRERENRGKVQSVKKVPAQVAAP